MVGNFSPYSATWNIEVEHSVTKNLRVRANYLQSNSLGLVVFTQKVVQGQDALVLGGGGRSGYNQLELTARVSLDEGQQLFFSYVRSRSDEMIASEVAGLKRAYTAGGRTGVAAVIARHMDDEHVRK